MIRDLLDCLDDYQGKIGPANALYTYINMATKMTSQFGLTEPSIIRSMFKRLGECHDLTINAENLELLDQHYLVWYKDNSKGENGPQFVGSNNYRVSEFRAELLSDMPSRMKIVNSNSIIDKIKNDLTESVSLITIKDTTLNKSLLLDGTKRLMALQYIKSKYPEIYHRLDFPKYPVKLFRMMSPIARIIYPIDFYKLI
jgi:hypothetical protein